jgi:hypothetical protein
MQTTQRQSVKCSSEICELGPTIRLDKRAECVEEPAMAVQFLLVLFLEAEDDLEAG